MCTFEPIICLDSWESFGKKRKAYLDGDIEDGVERLDQNRHAATELGIIFQAETMHPKICEIKGADSIPTAVNRNRYCHTGRSIGLGPRI